MKKTSVIISVLSILLGLAAMCLCSILIAPRWSGFASYLVFVCMAGVLAFTAANESNSQRAKTTSFCVVLGLIGIAVMQLCSQLLPAFVSGLAAFIVFLIFAAVILVIFKKQKTVLDAERRCITESRREQDAAAFILSTLRTKGVAEEQIRDILINEYGIDAQTVESLLSAN